MLALSGRHRVHVKPLGTQSPFDCSEEGGQGLERPVARPSARPGRVTELGEWHRVMLHVSVRALLWLPASLPTPPASFNLV